MRFVLLANLLDLGLLLLDALELRADPLPALAHRGEDDRVERAADQEKENDEADRVGDELIDVYELIHEASWACRGRALRARRPRVSRSDPEGRTS